LGADVMKVNLPHPEKQDAVPEPCCGEFSSQQALDAVIRLANRTLVLISEAPKPATVIEKARESMDAVATGLIYGRDAWRSLHADSLRLVSSLREIVAKHPSSQR
jgi:class I fructose-bisphosphate aldolase